MTSYTFVAGANKQNKTRIHKTTTNKQTNKQNKQSDTSGFIVSILNFQCHRQFHAEVKYDYTEIQIYMYTYI